MTRIPAILLAAASLLASLLMGADLKPEAVQAYERYNHDTEARLAASKPFLWADASPERLRLVKQGQIVVEPAKGDGDTFIPGASIHDWIGAIFIPGATLEKTLAVLQDYDHHKSIYKDVPESKLIAHNGDEFKYYRLRALHNGPVNGVFRTEFEAHYQQIDPARWVCQTRTTRVTEIEDYGKSKARELQPGHGSGYLWRLNGYWRLEQRDGGVYLECESTSLTRGLPPIIGALFVSSTHTIEREGLTATLQATRDAARK
ncbi:MAG TPA: hypothetical protein VMR62_10440 [Bryobacteraceae bacterium]|nr:hypothetical protein [Bryobacteraceae bacterium]